MNIHIVNNIIINKFDIEENIKISTIFKNVKFKMSININGEIIYRGNKSFYKINTENLNIKIENLQIENIDLTKKELELLKFDIESSILEEIENGNIIKNFNNHYIQFLISKNGFIKENTFKINKDYIINNIIKEKLEELINDLEFEKKYNNFSTKI